MANPNVSVANQLERVLAQGGPLMEQARTQGMQAANRRGLLNSSIATGAAQQAVTNVALPIASQQAGQAQQRVLQRGQHQQERQLSQQDFRQNRQLSKLGFRQDRKLQAKGLGSTERIAQMNIDASRLEKGGATAAAMESIYAQMFSSLQQNPELPASVRDQYLAHAGRIRDSNMALVEQLYGIELDWRSPALAPAASSKGDSWLKKSLKAR